VAADPGHQLLLPGPLAGRHDQLVRVLRRPGQSNARTMQTSGFPFLISNLLSYWSRRIIYLYVSDIKKNCTSSIEKAFLKQLSAEVNGGAYIY
jgi:hypothetical protein